MATTVNKQFWQGTNFWQALVLLIGGFWVGFPQEDATGAVASIFALIATVFGIREKVKGAAISFKDWITSSNTWNYIATAAVSIIPALPADLFTSIHDVLKAAIGGNWQGIAVGVFSLVTIIYNLAKKK